MAYALEVVSFHYLCGSNYRGGARLDVPRRLSVLLLCAVSYSLLFCAASLSLSCRVEMLILESVEPRLIGDQTSPPSPVQLKEFRMKCAPSKAKETKVKTAPFSDSERVKRDLKQTEDIITMLDRRRQLWEDDTNEYLANPDLEGADKDTAIKRQLMVWGGESQHCGLLFLLSHQHLPHPARVAPVASVSLFAWTV